MVSDRSAWPQPPSCPLCEIGGAPVATESYSQSVMGVRTHLYVCTDCLKGIWYRYVPGDPTRFLAVDTAPTSSHLVQRALIGMGWTPPRGKSRPDWTPPA